MTDPSVTTISSYPRARWWAAIGIVAVVVGAAASTIWFIWALGQVEDDVDALVVVSATSSDVFVLDEAVDWTIYLEPASRSLSGVRFEVIDVESGEPVVLESPRNGVNFDVGGRSGRPISRAQLDAGTYRIEVTPGDATLAVGPDVGDQVQQMWLGAFVIALPTVLGGGIVASVNLLRALRSAPVRTAEEPDPGDDLAPPSGGESSPPTPPPPTRPPLPPPDPTQRRDR